MTDTLTYAARLDAFLTEIERLRDAVLAEKTRHQPGVPVSRAAGRLRITYEAALKRAQRSWKRRDGQAFKVGGKYYFSAAYLDTVSE